MTSAKNTGLLTDLSWSQKNKTISQKCSVIVDKKVNKACESESETYIPLSVPIN